ncbi:MAG: hypothetical protein OXD43_09300 [Bacteroidetes bacterium]|nr:hypothetical protein [Bacteroidota bacterium]
MRQCRDQKAMNLEILISTAGYIITLIIALWCMNASQIKRIDQLSRSLRGDISELRSTIRNDISEFRGGFRSEFRSAIRNDISEFRSAIRNDISEFRSAIRNDISEFRSAIRNDISEFRSEVRNDISELRKGQKKLIDSMARLDSRVSRLEGMLQPRPWVEAPTGDMPPVSATQG